MQFKALLTWLTIPICLAATSLQAQPKTLPGPSNAQYSWHELERILFIHFGVATWMGTEYDMTGEFDLSRMNPGALDTDQWCEAAKSWGAKQIILVAKHVGSFCWWPTPTSSYSVANIPWKNGKGDLMKQLRASCDKYQLKMGVYIYPGDIKYGAGLGSGGKTSDPNLQEAYNRIFRQQLTEVLTNYGDMTEVWFDGSCIIDVKDILEKHAPNAVIFQGPQASIRWPGDESGKLHYPVWNTVQQTDLATGVATQFHDDPDGDAWAPLESDVTLYNHNWFWSPENEKKRRSVKELMEIYYKSVGYGGVLLLNASPDTTGRIPIGDMQRYAEFGKEINRRFKQPLQSLRDRKGNRHQLNFARPTALNHVIIKEAYEEGQRIRQYRVEGLVNGQWKLLSKGSSVGRMKIDPFKTISLKALRIVIDSAVSTPLLKSIEVYNVDGYTHKTEPQQDPAWTDLGTIHIDGTSKTVEYNLDAVVTAPGQFEIRWVPTTNSAAVDVSELIFWIDGDQALPQFVTTLPDNGFRINRTAQVTAGSSTKIRLTIIPRDPKKESKGMLRIRKL